MIDRSASAPSPRATGHDSGATLSSSRSISNSPNSRVSGCPPELADPLDPVQVRETLDVEELGASGRRQCLEAVPERVLHLLKDHGWTRYDETISRNR
jgi:hypothetical protein